MENTHPQEDDFDDLVMDYADARFEIRPYPTYRDLMQINALVNELGYTMPYSTKEFSREDVQAALRSEGPHAFLQYSRLREDISPKAPFTTAKEFVADRLGRLATAEELVIVDPYLFPPTPALGEEEYAIFLASLVAPILEAGASLTCIVNRKANPRIQKAVTERLQTLVPGISIAVHRSEDFHDRFWIADRARGVVVGASLNGLGGRLFFIDELKTSDVAAIVNELERTLMAK